MASWDNQLLLGMHLQQSRKLLKLIPHLQNAPASLKAGFQRTCCFAAACAGHVRPAAESAEVLQANTYC